MILPTDQDLLCSLPMRHFFYGFSKILRDHSCKALSEQDKAVLSETSFLLIELSSEITKHFIRNDKESTSLLRIADAKNDWQQNEQFQSFRKTVETLHCYNTGDLQQALMPLIKILKQVDPDYHLSGLVREIEYNLSKAMFSDSALPGNKNKIH
ncbi:hypothetical protein [Neptuniibacter sp.]|uniref:hypothetical protein n=1 Tax=Neptuniibacter sp. TaxID=1962643 RepID=UPI0026046DEA|nr:hypothetical protein [Neptuniibacter sp.]MCP4595419.1 hypothetical protein [Neptuniibacter sp.]